MPGLTVEERISEALLLLDGITLDATLVTNVMQRDLDRLVATATTLRDTARHCLARAEATPRSSEHESRSPDGNTVVLSKDQVWRYSRQLLLDELGRPGQERLCAASVLVVGAGGLGCPAALYLAGAGVGCIGVVDHDVVEVHNLQRQVAHHEQRIGMQKAVSLTRSLRQLNSDVVTHAHVGYDVVLDCTDNVATRYLLNDACVLLGLPLVSGSALRWEGQITVYAGTTADQGKGPCYRCLFPRPPPSDSVTNCSDGGVVGAVTGVIGSQQAMETVKVILGIGKPLVGALLMVDTLRCTMRRIPLRPRCNTCAVCGDDPSILELLDYEQFCGSAYNDSSDAAARTDVLSGQWDDAHVSCATYQGEAFSGRPHLILDVRSPVEFGIVHLPDSVNAPLPMWATMSATQLHEYMRRDHDIGVGDTILCVCRRGLDSQAAVRVLREAGFAQAHNLRGGLRAWTKTVDPDFPTY